MNPKWFQMPAFKVESLDELLLRLALVPLSSLQHAVTECHTLTEYDRVAFFHTTQSTQKCRSRHQDSLNRY